MPREVHHFLFGAGASFGSGTCIPDVPPLGKNLFAQFRKHCSVADQIPAEIQDLFEDFELGMDTLLVHKPHLQQAFQRDLAKYFTVFEPGTDNLYRQFIHGLKYPGTKHVTFFWSLNYDMLLERSIELEGFSYDHYITIGPRGTVPVLKLHGSCNIVPNPRGEVTGILLVGGGIAGNDVITLSREELVEWYKANDTLVPCIALYHPSKAIHDHSAPFRALQEHWKRQLPKANRLFVIGVNLVPQDTHIWETVKQFKGKIHWISPGGPPSTWAAENALEIDDFARSFKSFVFRYFTMF